MSRGDEPDEPGATRLIPRAKSKVEAKRVLALCAGIELSWDGYYTPEGLVIMKDKEFAQAIWDGVLDPGPGRPNRIDWNLVEELALNEARKLFIETGRKPVNRTEIVRRVVRIYPQRHPEGDTLSDPTKAASSLLRKRVREALEEIGH